MDNMNKIMNGWFSEICPMWPGVALSLKIERVLYSKKSDFQKIDLYETRNHGLMLVLNGIIQLTMFDEYSYQEMMAHVPLFAHPDPERILVIGGGDGGILREAGRHEGIKRIDFCEIDPQIIEVAKAYLPEMACGFDDPRITIHIEDGCEFVHKRKNEYDVIIVDSSDPIGPGETLYKKSFYQGMKDALNDGGIIATQGESFFLHQEWVKNLTKITKQLFKKQAYSYVMVPTYPGGNIGICLASMGPELKKPARKVPSKLLKQLKYYSPAIHEASFVLPRFVDEMLEDI
jgi:spermidine synthase